MFHIQRYDPTKGVQRPNDTMAPEQSHGKEGKRKRRRTNPENQSSLSQNDSGPPTSVQDAHRFQATTPCAGKANAVLESTTRDAQSRKKVASVPIIAPEIKPVPSRPIDSIMAEGFDDLDLVGDVIEDATYDDDDTPRAALSDIKDDNVAEAIRMSKLPLLQAAHQWKLAPFLIHNLQAEGFGHFFPIQAMVIPNVIQTDHNAHVQVRDVCLTAPTGSGKTLAFVLPILNALYHSGVHGRLRALMVLPSRDLAQQVYNVVHRYAQGSPLCVGLATGQHNFRAEQIALTVAGDCDDNPVLASRQRLRLEPTNLDAAIQMFGSVLGVQAMQQSPRTLSNDQSTDDRTIVDVLVCTPGRLVDHLDYTPGFSLQHLQYLVADEADRLLSQWYHNWIGRVLDAARASSEALWSRIARRGGLLLPADTPICPRTWRRPDHDGIAASNIAAVTCQPVQLRKFLCSATLTRDPQKLAMLQLVNPQHFDVHQLYRDDGGSKKYTMPATLQEHITECTAEHKPLVLLATLLDLTARHDMVVVFTSSLDATHRLARLLQLLWPAAWGRKEPSGEEVVEFSSMLPQPERSRLVARCNDNTNSNIQVVVCSDGMSRGLDLRRVGAVVHYDVPRLAKTYVHRCGRTARAGQAGVAVALCKAGQVSAFHRLRALIQDAARVQPMKVRKELVRPIVGQYSTALSSLKVVLQAETDGKLRPTQPIPVELLQS